MEWYQHANAGRLVETDGRGSCWWSDGEIGQGQGKTSKSPEKERERRSACGIAGYVELRKRFHMILLRDEYVGITHSIAQYHSCRCCFSFLSLCTVFSLISVNQYALS